MNVRRVLLVIKKSAYSMFRDGRTRGEEQRLRRLLESGHHSVASIRLAQDEHLASVRQVRRELRERGIPFVDRSALPTKVVRGFDLVITIGGDGTLLQASHAVRGKTVVLGVNSAPAFSVGFLTGCRAPTFARTLDALLEDRVAPLVVQRLQLRIARRRVPEPVLNDVLFCHDNPAMTARYELRGPGGVESQRSSGIWISTPAGSTAALRSAGGTALALTDRRFAYVVREPYAPPGSHVRFVGGVLAEGERLALECRIPQASVFIDGSHRRYHVGFGEVVSFTLHEQPLLLMRPKPDNP